MSDANIIHFELPLPQVLPTIDGNVDYRDFAVRLADSPLLQFFVGIGEVDRVRVPSKSTLQRYDLWWKEPEVRQITHQLLCQGAQRPQQLQIAQPLDLESAFLDTTC